MEDPDTSPSPWAGGSLLQRLRERGVVRVAVSYVVIAWLTLQIADVVFEPLGIPAWAMTALVIAALAGFPIAIALAWFLEIGAHGVEVDTATVGVPRPTARGLRRYADMIVIGVLVVAVAVLAVRQSDLGKPKPPENPAIAVLPFANMSGDPEQEYFSDGLAQEVLDRLGRIPGLTVIARSSSFAYKGKDADSRTIARQLGATTLLGGSVRRDGERLRLSAQLVDGATGREIWSGTFDRRMSDVFAVQEELAGAIIDAIVPTARGEASKRPMPLTADVKAYDLYLLGRQAQEARTGWRLRDSVSYFEQAIASDPKFAKAHAALARSLALWRYYREIPPPDDVSRRAEAEAHAALALDPDSSEAHAALATAVRDEHPETAEREYQRALELNSNNVAALWDYVVLLGNTLSRLPA
jgi:adenylate cyclase